MNFFGIVHLASLFLLVYTSFFFFSSQPTIYQFSALAASTVFAFLYFFLIRCNKDKKNGLNRYARVDISSKNLLIAGFTASLIFLLITANIIQNESLKSQVFQTHNSQLLSLTILNDVEINTISEKTKRLRWLAKLHTAGNPIIRLDWYLPHNTQVADFGIAQLPRKGDVWQTHLRLKINHVPHNPAAFDYEKYLFSQNISGKGIVKKPPDNQKFTWKLLSTEDKNRFRENIISTFKKRFHDYDLKGIYLALLIGDRSLMTDTQWQVLQETGTSHLMAISGLHMGILVMLTILFSKLLWRLLFYRFNVFDFVPFAALSCMLFTTLYLWLSGAAIPTQRAWIMTMVFCVFALIDRKFQPWTAFSWALILVLIWEPRSVLMIGFWLSFLAVFVIFLFLNTLKSLRYWQSLLILQVILSISLLPVTMFFFGQYPLSSFFANLLAVPFVTFIGMPGLILFSFLDFIHTELADIFMNALDVFWLGLWSYLLWLKTIPMNLLVLPEQSWIWLLTFYLGIVFFIKLFQSSTPKIKPFFAAGFILLILFLTWKTPVRPLWGEYILSVLDVGQGQSLIVETSDNIVVYDVGAKVGKFDAADFYLVPTLKAKMTSTIHSLVLSHSDNDHSGAFHSLNDAFLINRIFSGQPDKFQAQFSIPSTQCLAGQQFEVDGVVFKFLAPHKEALNQIQKDNNFSCVLQISNSSQEFKTLITGDLELTGELDLINRHELKSEILIAGHHGSNSSTGQSILKQTNPNFVIYSSGYQNYFDFPSEKVIQRVVQNNPQTIQLNTACHGEIVFYSATKKFKASRIAQTKWYHHQCSNSLK